MMCRRSIVLSEDMLDRVRSNAEKIGVSPSEFMRHGILDFILRIEGEKHGKRR